MLQNKGENTRGLSTKSSTNQRQNVERERERRIKSDVYMYKEEIGGGGANARDKHTDKEK